MLPHEAFGVVLIIVAEVLLRYLWENYYGYVLWVIGVLTGFSFYAWLQAGVEK